MFYHSVIKLTLISLLFGAFLGCSSTSKEDKKQKMAMLYYGHGTDKLLSQDYTSALSYLRKAVEYDEKNSNIHNNLGLAYYYKQQYADAKNHFQKSLILDPKNSDARNNLATLYYHRKQFQLAESEYKIILKDLVYPKQFQIYFNLATLELRKGNTHKAVSLLKQSIKERPDYCQAHYTLGTIAKENYDFKKAIQYFKEATKGICYNQPAPVYELGIIHAKLGELNKARARFSDIITRFEATDFAAKAETYLSKLNSSNKSF